MWWTIRTWEESTEHSETSSASTHLCELQGMNMLVNILTVPRLLRRHLDHSLPKWLNDLQFLIHRFQKKWNPWSIVNNCDKLTHTATVFYVIMSQFFWKYSRFHDDAATLLITALSMTLIDLWPQFQGHYIFRHWISQKRHEIAP